MQFKKAQHEMIEKIVELSDDIIQVAEKSIGTTHRKIFEFSSNSGIVLVFKKRGNHRYWYLIDKKEFENTRGGDINQSYNSS